MATVFGVDLDEIETNKLLRREHVETIYGVLSGDPEYSDESHILNFQGSFLSGKNNEKDSSTNFGFAFGENNRVNGENSLVIGKDGESYAENQVVLSGGSISTRGDAQSYLTTRSLSVSVGNLEAVEIPTKDNCLSFLRIKVAAVEDSSDTSWTEDYLLVYFNSRTDPDQSDKVGKILDLERTYLYDSSGVIENETVEPFFQVVGTDLVFAVDDNRSSGSEYNINVDVEAAEVFSAEDIIEGGAQGYGEAEYEDAGVNEGVDFRDITFTCFDPSSEVLLSDGSTTKQLSDLSEGEELFSVKSDNIEDFENYEDYSEELDELDEFELTTTTVTDIYYGFSNDVYLLNDEIILTGKQPALVLDPSTKKMYFVDAEKITTDLKILNKEKEFVDVESIESIEGVKEVVTLDVEESDVFFVENLMFHNK